MSFPHTGIEIPDKIEENLVSPWLARKDTDFWVDVLYDFAHELGATTIRTALSRTVIDVNRDPSGASLYPGQTTTGLCPLETFDGEPLYKSGSEAGPAEFLRRRAEYFDPYHSALGAELERKRAQFGCVVLYDAHSIRSRVPRLFEGRLPQFNIGTNNGMTCAPDAHRLDREDLRCLGLHARHQWPLPRRLDHAALRQPGLGGSRRANGARHARLSARARRCAVHKTNWPVPLDDVHAARLRVALRDILDACINFANSAEPLMNRATATDHPCAHRHATDSPRSWLTEAPLRMLMNNLDPAVAERPEELVVYGGIGRAARNWECFDAIVATLRRLEADQTLLIQSGKPVGVFQTHADAPRVLLANSNLVPRWSTWEHFNELDRKGLMMFGQMTAGSWIYIGSQGIVQGTYETFVEMGRQHYGGTLAGRWLLTAGLGGMGGAQPLACVMAGASCLAVECQQSRIDMRLKSGYLDHGTDKLDEALELIARACRDRKPISVGLLGNAAEVLPELLKRGVRPDLLTDQTSAHDPVNGYLPIGWTVDEWIDEARQRSGKPWQRRPRLRWPCTCAPCWISRRPACTPSTTATTSARWRWKKA